MVRAITAVYLASFLELVFSAMVSLIGQKNGGFERQYSSNIVSAVFMVFSIVIMMTIIITNIYVARRYRNQMKDPLVNGRYGFIYDGFKTDTFMTAIFQVIFLIRRVLFVTIIILLNDFSGL